MRTMKHNKFMWIIKMTFIQPTICSIDVNQDSHNKIKYNNCISKRFKFSELRNFKINFRQSEHRLINFIIPNFHEEDDTNEVLASIGILY